MKRRDALAGVALVAAGSVPARAVSARKITLTIPSIGVDEGPFFVAVRKGYFASEGLEAAFVTAGGGIATPGLLSGSVDGSASPASALTAILRGAPLRVVLVFEDTPPYQIWAGAGIRTLGDLAGKAIGIATRGDTLEIATRLALKDAGVAPEAVGFTPLGSGGAIPAALQSGAVAAAVVTPTGIVAMQDQGLFKNVHQVADLSGHVHMPVAGFAVAEKLLYGEPAPAKRMIRAIVKGARYQKAFREAAIAIVGTYEDPPHPHANEVEFDSYARAATRDETFEGPAMATDLGVRAALMGLDPAAIPPAGKIYDFTVAHAVNAELDRSGWQPVR